MASLITRENGSREVRFIGFDGKRKTLRLGKLTKKSAAEIKRKVEHLAACRQSGSTPDPSVTDWICTLDESLHGRLVALDLARPRSSVKVPSLGDWLDQYLAEHPGKASTLSALKKGRDNLIEFFTGDRPLDSITVHDAKRWENWLRTSGNRRDIKKGRTELNDGTVRRRVSHAKQFFTAAVEAEHITKNPFVALRSTVRGNPERQFFVPTDWIEACIEWAPNRDWKTILALCRFGGLRCPSEVLGLRWQDVSLPEGWMVIRSSKTAHHANRGIRRCPIFPELKPYLEAAWDEASEGRGSEFVVERYRGAQTNLRTRFEAIISAAGLKRWPKLFQNLRASRETELLAAYPAKDVVSWLGNSVAVAMEHYAMPREESFQKAIREGTGKAHQNAHHSRAIGGNQEASTLDDGHQEITQNAVNDASGGQESALDESGKWAIQNSNL